MLQREGPLETQDRNHAMCRPVHHLMVNDGLREGCAENEEQVTFE